MTEGALTDLLLRRLLDARAKGHIEDLLRSAKVDQNLPPRAFRVTGTVTQIEDAVRTAVAENHLTDAQLAALVDEMEENGGQHVFLFDLTPDGRKFLTSNRLAETYPHLPARPTPSMYAELPAEKRTYFSSRADGLVVKQIRTAHFWEWDEKESKAQSREDRRVDVTVKRARRAVNLFKIHPENGTAEIRIDRVRGRDDGDLCREMFLEFAEVLEKVVEFGKHIVPVPIWTAFPAIVEARDRTYMAVDQAQDASVAFRISNRRERDKGSDVRDHPAHAMKGPDYARDWLNVYWLLSDDRRIHTVLTRLKLDETRCYGKVYVSAKANAEELAHVLQWIREFAS